MQHIERLIWKPINWYPESPDQYPGGLPIYKPQIFFVELSDGRWLWIQGLPLGASVEVDLIEGKRRSFTPGRRAGYPSSSR